MKTTKFSFLALLLLLCACSQDKSNLPIVITSDCTVYQQSATASCNGFVESDGGSAVIERGICYAEGSTTPDMSNKHVSAGSGKGSFSCQLTNLQSGANYSYRAYAINSKGTAYGNVRSFIMNDVPSQGGDDENPSEPTITPNSELTIAQFKRLPDNNSNWFSITGVVYDITDDSKGSMHIYDNTGMLPVCIVTATKQSSLTSDNSFRTLGISPHDSITLCGVKSTKNGVPVMTCGYLVKKHGQMIPNVYSLALEPRETNLFEIDNSFELSVIKGGGKWIDVEVKKQGFTLHLDGYSDQYDPSSLTKIGAGAFYIYYAQLEPDQAIFPSYGYQFNGNNGKGSISGSYLMSQPTFEQYALYFIIGGRMVVSEINGKARFEFDLNTQNGSTITGSWTGTPELIIK